AAGEKPRAFANRFGARGLLGRLWNRTDLAHRRRQRSLSPVEPESENTSLVAVFDDRARVVRCEPAAPTPGRYDGDVLNAVDGVGHRRGDDRRADLDVLHDLAGLRIERAQMA